MARTAIIYEGNYPEAETAVKNLMRIAGAGRYFQTSDFPPIIKDDYDLYCIGGSVDGGKLAAGISDFVDANRDWLAAKRVFLFSLGSGQTSGESHFATLKEKLGGVVLGSDNVVAAPGELDLPAVTETGLRIRAIKEGLESALPPEKVREHVENFLSRHKYCILCTAYGDRVRGTAVTYKYHQGYIYFEGYDSVRIVPLKGKK